MKAIAALRVLRRATRRGNCYVTSEALYHLLGGKTCGWTPATVRHEGAVHWFLRHASGLVVDATASQFRRPPPYYRARGRGFLTRRPSRRALELMRVLVWQNVAMYPTRSVASRIRGVVGDDSRQAKTRKR